ncbi:OB-fold protein [Sorangium sp. So ce124]|uniref:OB-fold protein n=1 Tax=Sorangium sp. So ce124 TaxID=3133280 RepID=UPI003F60FDA1
MRVASAAEVRMVRWMGVAAMLLLAVGCKGQERGGEARPVTEAPGAAATTAQPAAAPAPAKPKEPAREAAQHVDIKKLLGEYHDNEVRADGAFKGKLVQVTGLVGDVKKDITGSIYVTVGTGTMLEIPTLQCFVAEGETGAAAALSKGQKVTVRGRVDGLMMNVLVKDCEINPVMKLCKRLQGALGAKECRSSDETGDANALVVKEDGKAATVGFLDCVAPKEHVPLAEVYDFMTTKRQLKEHQVVIGSKAAGCYGVFWASDAKGAKVPLPDDIKTKAQAFFDTL